MTDKLHVFHDVVRMSWRSDKQPAAFAMSSTTNLLLALETNIYPIATDAEPRLFGMPLVIDSNVPTSEIHLKCNDGTVYIIPIED